MAPSVSYSDRATRCDTNHEIGELCVSLSAAVTRFASISTPLAFSSALCRIQLVLLHNSRAI